MYEKLKNQLINRLSLTEGQRVRKLLGREELGDRKPSQFLKLLRSLAGAIEKKTYTPSFLVVANAPPLHAQAFSPGTINSRTRPNGRYG
ncbi:hypothetical protein TNIN_418961 [Trichonephila inaurata madagascariensis]|uniref:Uncharacterized protein n=1 Tax=Trichonephila inaurata madagascariensis TaxID=2747483 RepID=A0A8X6WPN3_9ARAC|nr:hypothetical protein TNIN_418961 [Trichonephila inaurata madagascariensis]